MNINIYLEDALGKQLNQYCKDTGMSRNAIVREAIKDWMKHHQILQWPETILNFKGYAEFPPLEATRRELLPPKEDYNRKTRLDLGRVGFF